MLGTSDVNGKHYLTHGVTKAVTLTEMIEERKKNADLKGYTLLFNNVITNPQL